MTATIPDSNDIANQAIQLIGDNQPAVTGFAPNFDDSAAGKALKWLYDATVATVARSFGWDFARKSAALVLSGNVAPFPWDFEYLYPTRAPQIWQLMPPDGPSYDENNPLPQNWLVGNAQVSSVQTKVIWSNLASAVCIYNNNPSEATWDPLFRESVVRLLANVLSTALEGRPDLAQVSLENYTGFQNRAEARAD